ncbi:hypothetical protein Bca101_019594 [Brassica carinata]
MQTLHYRMLELVGEEEIAANRPCFFFPLCFCYVRLLPLFSNPKPTNSQAQPNKLLDSSYDLSASQNNDEDNCSNLPTTTQVNNFHRLFYRSPLDLYMHVDNPYLL